MAIEAKVVLLNGMEQKLSTVITASDMTKVLSILSDQLAFYEVKQIDHENGAPDDMLDAYLSALRVQGRSPKTIERYSYLLKKLMSEIKIPTRSITVHHLRRYLADEKVRGLSDRTLEGIREVLSAYFGWLWREGLIESNPTANLGAIKCVKKIKVVYSEVDMERLKTKCGQVRDKAIIAFLASTGCRISEMCQLNRDDVDLNNLECTVLGKGNKERTVYLDPVAGMMIKEYLSERTDDHPALFVGKGTDRLHPGGVRNMMKKLGERANVNHVHPHKFRRTLATNLIRHGMAVQEVASILGHDKLDTTMQYVVLNKTDIKNSYQKYT